MRILIALVILIPTMAQAQTTPERWELFETIRIGEIDGTNALTEIHYLLVGQDRSRIYVGQRQEHTIRVFDSTSGELLRTIGRAGNGPGEFQGIARLGWKQDTLYAVDSRLHRISLFSADGSHLRTDRILSAPLTTTRRPAIPKALGAGGTVIGESTINMASAASGLTTSAPVVLMTLEGEVIQKLAERQLSGDFAIAEIGSRIIVFRQPLTKDLFWDVDPSGSSMVVVNAPGSSEESATFEVTRIRLAVSPDTIFSRNYRYTPRPISGEVRDSIYREYAPGDEPSARDIEAIKAVVRLPSSRPPVSAAVLGAEGSTWLRMDQATAGSVTWVVLDVNGGINATVRVPRGLTILAVDGDVVWGMVRGDLDVPYIVGYEVKPARPE